MSGCDSLPAIKVLIVDDDQDTREIVSVGVISMGFEPVTAVDGQEGLSIFESEHPDIIVLDVMMPHLTGNEVCARIKASDEGQYTPIIMLTACDSLEDKVTSLEGGADDYLTKPFQMRELQARLKAMLRVRALNVKLRDQNRTLVDMQAKLVEQERRILVGQLAGTAAHQLGQPLSAIMLNCHLLQKLPQSDDRHQKAVTAIQQDSKRMADLLEKLKGADASKTTAYFKDTQILEIKE